MDVIKSAVEHLNAAVLTFDQPLFALAKQIQWKWPEKYGEDKLAVMFGGLHIEMAALKTIGDWLKGSGWAQALVQAEIATAVTVCTKQHMLCVQEEHTKSLLLLCITYNIVPTTVTVQMANPTWSLRSGVIRESRVVLSFSFGRQHWN